MFRSWKNIGACMIVGTLRLFFTEFHKGENSENIAEISKALQTECLFNLKYSSVVGSTRKAGFRM